MSYKRIFISLAVIVAVGAGVAGATGAFYSDTETSEDNIFTAGSVDLQVDHLKQTYNGEECTTNCDKWAKEVDGFNQGEQKNDDPVEGSRSDPTAATGEAETGGTNPDSSPSGFVSLGFGGSITLHFPNGIDDRSGNDLKIYEATGDTNPAWPDERVSVEVSPNGSDWTTIAVGPQNETTFDGEFEIDMNNSDTSATVYYVRITDITDESGHGETSDAFDLDAVEALNCDDEQTDGKSSDIWQCELWEEANLTSERFFKFNDVKPGDYGSNVISLHAFSNDTYSCLVANDGEDNENEVLEAEGDDNADEGELQDYIEFFAWSDDDADANYDSGSETDLGTSTLGNLASIARYDSETGQSLTATSTEYVGLEWCAGSISVDDGEVNCDGSGMQNDAQSDQFESDLSAYAVQTRNNGDFSCDDVSKEDLQPEQS